MASSVKVPLTKEKLDHLREAFYKNKLNVVAQNVCMKQDASELCINQSRILQLPTVFNHKIDMRGICIGNDVTIMVHMLQDAVNKAFDIHDFEFSISFLEFWLKVENSNYFLNKVVHHFKDGLKVSDKKLHHLLVSPIWGKFPWSFVKDVLLKHGITPKQCYFDDSSFSHISLEILLDSKLRVFARDIRKMVAEEASDETLKEAVNQMMREVYRLAALHCGTPPKEFTWEFYDDDKKYRKIGPITPREFFAIHVTPYFNIRDQVSLLCYPEEKIPVNQLYRFNDQLSLIGNPGPVSPNVQIEELIDMAKNSIKEGKPVLLLADFTNCSKKKILDLQIMKGHEMLAADVTALDKAERCAYQSSHPSGYAVIHSLMTTEDDKPLRWGVTASSLELLKSVMTTEWFTAFGFGIVIDKKFVPEEVMAIFQQSAKVVSLSDL